MERIRNLPNFFCDMAIRRSRFQIKSGRPMWSPITKEILVRVRWVDGQEDYKTLRLGQRRAKKPHWEIGKQGLKSRGEFGGLLALVRHMDFRWLGVANLGNRSVYLFNVSVDKSVGHLIRRDNSPGGRVAWRGIICIDSESNHTLAIALEAVNIPLSFGISKDLLSVVFSEVLLDDRTFLLPSASESIADATAGPTFRQSSRYRNYQKFDVESELQFENIESTVTYPRRSK